MKIKKHHNITKVKNDGQSKNDFLQYGGGEKEKFKYRNFKNYIDVRDRFDA